MKGSELRDMDNQQLDDRLAELQQELFTLRFQFATRQLTNTSRIRQVRRDIARIRTRQRELELAASAGRAGE